MPRLNMEKLSARLDRRKELLREAQFRRSWREGQLRAIIENIEKGEAGPATNLPKGMRLGVPFIEEALRDGFNTHAKNVSLNWVEFAEENAMNDNPEALSDLPSAVVAYLEKLTSDLEFYAVRAVVAEKKLRTIAKLTHEEFSDVAWLKVKTSI